MIFAILPQPGMASEEDTNRTRYEAEDIFYGGPMWVADNDSASGKKVLANVLAPGSFVGFEATSPATSVDICYSSDASISVGIFINGDLIEDMVLDSTGREFRIDSLDVYIKSGDHFKIQISSYGTMVMDYIDTYVKPLENVGIMVNPAKAMFHLAPVVPKDVAVSILCPETLAVTDVLLDGDSIGAGNYSAEAEGSDLPGLELTLKKEFFAAKALGDLEFEIVFSNDTVLPLTV